MTYAFQKGRSYADFRKATLFDGNGYANVQTTSVHPVNDYVYQLEAAEFTARFGL